MPSSRARAADIKLLISATVGVLLAGFLVAGGVFVATRSKGSVVCGQLNIGSATNVRQTLQNGGPYFQTGGAGCGFWLALADGNIVAYKVDQPQGCALQLKRDHWECGKQTVPVDGLAQYDVSIQSVGQTDSVIIDLLPPGSAPSSTTVTTARTPEHLAAAAYIWGYPLVVTERTMQTLALRVGVNHLLFQPALSDATSRSVVAPNTDTLYGVAILDLRREPYVLTVPAIHDRYYSFQFISAYTDSFAYIGTRATGGRAGTWIITPPGWRGTVPAGATRIAAPTPQVVMLGRFLVKNPADVDRIHALGNRIHLQPLSAVDGTPPPPPPPAIGTAPGTPQSIATAGARFFDELGDALAINPPADPQEQATMRSFAPLGIGPGKHPSTTTLRPTLARGVAEGDATLARSAPPGNRIVDGWTVDVHTGVYGHDALLRAVTARGGWGANIPAEAVYTHASGDATGSPLSGTHDYVIHFAKGGLPPVNAFWSVTLYGPDHFFVANPINRYAIGDRTTGLRYGPGGSLDIYLQHAAPTGPESNWLPAPNGGFYLSLRMYLPKTNVLDGSYRYPKIERVR